MKKYIFMILMAGLLISCSNPADQKQPATKSEQPAITQEAAKPAAPPAPVPAPAPETKAAAPSAETKTPETGPTSTEAAKPAVESQEPAAVATAAPAEAAKEAQSAPAAPHTSDVTSDKPVAGPGVTEIVKAPAGQETPKTGQ